MSDPLRCLLCLRGESKQVEWWVSQCAVPEEGTGVRAQCAVRRILSWLQFLLQMQIETEMSVHLGGSPVPKNGSKQG